MFNVTNGSKMNSLKTIQEFSRTPEDIQGQQVVFQESRTLTSFDSKFKDNSWRPRTSGNLNYKAH